VSQPNKPASKQAKTHSYSPSVSHEIVSPIPRDLKAARVRIMNWVRAEDIPKNECERLSTADPNDPKHNLRVVYAANYALEMAGAIPGRSYAAKESARISEKALWILTKNLRQADPSIGTSESLFLRDAQRYLYGTLGEVWLQTHIHDKYHVPEIVAKHASGETIDKVYEKGVKRTEMVGNCIVEAVTGKNPGWGRGKANLPHSRPGGEAWYNLGRARFKEMHPENGPTKAGNPLLTTVPKF
jgi:hypothetical protein